MDAKLKQTLVDYGKKVVNPLIQEKAEAATFTNTGTDMSSTALGAAVKEAYNKAVDAVNAAAAADTKAQNAYNAANAADTKATNAATAAQSAHNAANDAHNAANNAANDAANAANDAENAQNTANSAYEAANSASTAAADAQNTADDAFNAANTAGITANSAYNAANDAANDAANADAKAVAAASAAQNAHNAANDAANDAANAQNTANSAYSAANAAGTKAQNAYDAANAADTKAQSAYDAANGAASAAANIAVAWDSTNKKITYTDSANTAHDVAAFALNKLGTATAGYTATYELTIGGTSIGKVDIPKDYLVKSATVETCTVADVPVEGYKVGDKYIDFVVNSVDGTGQESHIYLLVTDLVDVYTGTGAINIDNKNVISFVASAVNVAASGADKGVSATLGGDLGTTTLTIAVTAATDLNSANVLTGTALAAALPSTNTDFTTILNEIETA